nr:hypothetical protein [Caulobacter ginsengisoli]
MAPTTIRPRTPWRMAWAEAATRSRAEKLRRTSSANIAPSAVGRMPNRPRSNSVRPVTCSSWAMARVTVGWVMFSCRAARVAEPVSTTAWKTSRE